MVCGQIQAYFELRCILSIDTEELLMEDRLLTKSATGVDGYPSRTVAARLIRPTPSALAQSFQS